MNRASRVLSVIVLLAVASVVSGCYSCESYHKWKGTGRVPADIEDKVYWSPECKAWAAAQHNPPPVRPKPAPPKPKPEPASECGPYTVSRTYPSQGVIRLEKTMPKQVQVNAAFDYSIRATNLTDMLVDNVVVTERLASNFKFASATPAAKKGDSVLTWALGSLEPNASKEITVSGSATDTGCLTHCATVTYVVPACANVQVLQAKLRLVKTAPEEVLLCDTIPVKFVVTNAGTGWARNVTITDKLPEGLLTTAGTNQLAFDAGTLAAGQSKQFTANLKASKAGKYENVATASSAAGLKAEARTTTVVREPVLAITKTGPKRLYLGRSVTYEITVTNRGDGIAKNTVLEDTVPAGVTTVRASNGAKVSGSKLIWELGNLAPKASKKVSITYTPTKAGTVSDAATAVAYCAPKVTAKAQTAVAGIPAVLLEVIDLEDPIPVGENVTYEITATNQGSAPGTNIRITCILEDVVSYVSSSGATRGSLAGDKVTFAPLDSLAPKTKATWRVVVKVAKPGDARFHVRMDLDEFDRPVEETEATHLYE